MSTTMQASLPLGLHPHNNQGLFADHYLDHPERLQALDEPVLNLVWREQRSGDCYQVQVTIPTTHVHRQPD